MEGRFRFSLRSLMAATTLLAASAAVLARPSFIAANAVVSVTLLTLAVATVGSMACRNARRAFWIGFAVFGWLHFFLAMAPWCIDHTSHFLLTRQLLDRLWEVLGREHVTAGDTWSSFQVHQGKAAGFYEYWAFLFIGQSLSSLFMGAIGGWIGGRLYERSDSAA